MHDNYDIVGQRLAETTTEKRAMTKLALGGLAVGTAGLIDSLIFHGGDNSITVTVVGYFTSLVSGASAFIRGGFIANDEARLRK